MFKAARALPPQGDDILARAQAGDEAAFADLVKRHQAMVFSLALHVLGNRGAAEDAAQDVFLELYRRLAMIDSGAHLLFWLRRVTSHRCIDHMRRRAHRGEAPEAALPEPSVPPVTREIFLEARLRRLVATLPPRARIVVALRYQEDLEPSEIADVLNMPLNTVKSHLRRSLAVLRTKLARSEATSGL